MTRSGPPAKMMLPGSRPGPEELAHAFGGFGGGQNRRRRAVIQNRVQAADVTGLGRIEQRHRDTARIQRAEERDEVLEVLRAQDRHSIPGLGYLLQSGRDGTVAGAEVCPAEVVGDTVAFGGVIQKPIGEFVSANLRPPLNVLDEAGAFREDDPSVLDERVMERHTTLLSQHTPVSRRRARQRLSLGTPCAAASRAAHLLLSSS